MTGFVKRALLLGAAAAMMPLAACTQMGQQTEALSGDDWYAYGADDNQLHYSALDEINASNVSDLGLAWSYDIDSFDAYTQPLELNGVVYFGAGLSVIRALDAKTGKLLWEYDPKVADAPDAGTHMRAGWGIRGIAYRNGKVFAATREGRLVAVDAKDGKELWSVQTLDEAPGAYITGPPLVAGNVVVIGFGGADYSPVRGYVTAYDINTGKKAWRWYVVPGNPAVDKDETTLEAAKTWTGEWWKFGGGGAVYHSMTYDPKYDRVYLGTGNGFPWNQKIRSPGGGDNLYLASIVALDAKTGKRAWHYQTNPGVTWDFNNAMDIGLTSLDIDGKPRDVLIHAPKNGFYYVIDRKTGKLVNEPGKFAKVNWAEKVDLATGRPQINPEALYPDGKPFVLFPFPAGAHGVQAMAHSPKTGLTYIPVMEAGRVHIDPANMKEWSPKLGMFVNTGLGAPPPDIKTDPPVSKLIAWDPVKQQKAWEVTTPNTFNGGVLATAGNLVFQGQNSGEIVALSADTGKQLWSFNAQNGILSAPITYKVDGKQYVTVIASYRSSFANQPNWDYRQQKRRVLTFALGAKGTLPEPEPYTAEIADDPAFVVDPAKAAIGAGIYNQSCNICHGAGMMAGGAAPDLRMSPIPLDAAAFRSVVHDGASMARGMGKFDNLTDEELEGLRHYIRQRARETKDQK
ncbi:MAG: PQQ-dependent dehydrogenase, methanol/ethanol family [Novosphingobium sp.]|nr:PQQ-dependent dehydrogenase, methanol/ethanol family [Novosphingobium sp.]